MLVGDGGNGSVGASFSGYVVTGFVVPEPSAFVHLGIGIIGLLASCWFGAKRGH